MSLGLKQIILDNQQNIDEEVENKTTSSSLNLRDTILKLKTLETEGGTIPTKKQVLDAGLGPVNRENYRVMSLPSSSDQNLKQDQGTSKTESLLSKYQNIATAPTKFLGETVKNFGSDLLKGLNLLLRTERATTELAVAPIAYLAGQLTPEKPEFKDIAQQQYNKAVELIKGDREWGQSVEEAGKSYVQSRNIKSISDLNFQDISVLSSLAMFNLLGDPIFRGQEVAKSIKEAALFKKTGEVRKAFGEGTRLIKPRTVEIPVVREGGKDLLKMKISPKNNELVIEGFARRNLSPSIIRSQEQALVRTLEENTGRAIQALRSGDNLIIRPTLLTQARVSQAGFARFPIGTEKEGKIYKPFNYLKKLNVDEYNIFNKVYLGIQDAVGIDNDLIVNLPSDITGSEAQEYINKLSNFGEIAIDSLQEIKSGLEELGYSNVLQNEATPTLMSAKEILESRPIESMQLDGKFDLTAEEQIQVMKDAFDIEGATEGAIDKIFYDSKYGQEIEDGYQTFSKLAKSRPWMIDDVTDVATLKSKLKNYNVSVENNILQGAQEVSDNELLDIFKERFITEKGGLEVISGAKEKIKISDKVLSKAIQKKANEEIKAFEKAANEEKRTATRALRKEIGKLRQDKKLSGVVLARFKEKNNIKEWKNATDRQLEAVIDDLKNLRQGDQILTKSRAESLKELGITPYTTKREAAEIFGDISTWPKKKDKFLDFFNTMDRRIEKMVNKEDQEKVKDILTRPRADAVTAMFKEEIALKKEMRNMLTKLGLNSKKYRQLIQRFGEQRMIEKEAIKSSKDIYKKHSTIKFKDIVNFKLQDPSLDLSKVKGLSKENQTRIQRTVNDLNDQMLKLKLETTEIELLKEKAPTKWKEIIEADNWFRDKYDNLLDRANEELSKYNITSFRDFKGDKQIRDAGLPPIPRRNDYYTHFRELNSIWSLLRDSAGDINPVLEGISEFTRPNRKFNPFGLERKGLKPFVEDGPRSFEAYLNPILDNIYMTKHITRHRAVADILAHNTLDTKNLNLFIERLQQVADSLAGKTNPFDRALLSTMIGRKTLSAIKLIPRQFAKNRIIGSVSSALMQTAGLPTSVLNNGFIHTARGLLSQALIAPFQKNDPLLQSKFLERRYGTTELLDDSIISKMTPLAKKKLYTTKPSFPTKTEKVEQFLSIPFELVERNITHAIWRASYANAYRQGYRDDILLRKADELTERSVGGRAPGEKALAFESGILSLPLQFQLEVNTHAQAWADEVFSQFKDKKKIPHTLMRAISTSITLFLLNSLYEETMGRTPLPDPIRTIQDVADSDKWWEKLGRIVGEGLSNVAGGQFIANLLPEDYRKKLFGRTEVGIYSGGIPAYSAIKNLSYDPDSLIYDFILPYGGAQLERIIEGVEAIDKQGVYTSSGKLKFPISDSELLQVVLFGKYSTEEAKEYYDNERTALSEKQTVQYHQLVMDGKTPQEAYNIAAESRLQKEFEEKIIKKLTKKIKQNPKEGLAIMQLWIDQGIISNDMEKEILESLQ